MVALGPGNIVLDVDPAPPKEHSPPDFGSYLLRPNGWMDEDALGTKVGVSPGHILLHGDIAPLPKGALPPNFWPTSTVAKQSPISSTAKHLLHFVVTSDLVLATIHFFFG